MKTKKRRVGLKLVLMAGIVVAIILYNKEDYRFIVANTVEKIAQGVEVEKVEIKKEDLQVVPLREIKNDHKIRLDDSLNLINNKPLQMGKNIIY